MYKVDKIFAFLIFFASLQPVREIERKQNKNYIISDYISDHD